MFSIIDRYVLKMFLGFFLGGLLVFVTLFFAVDAMSKLVQFADALPMVLVKYYAFYIPEVINQMIPVACLVGTLFTLATMNKNNELVALFSAGMSLLRVSLPILVGVLLISGANFFMADRLLPTFAKKKNYIFYVELKKNPSLYSMVKTNRIWYRSKNTLYNIKTLNQEANSAQGLTLYYFDDDWNLVQMMTAAQVFFKGSNWELEDGSVTLFTEESSFPLTSDFKKKSIVMGEDSKDLESTSGSTETLSLHDLSEFIHKNKEGGLDTIKYEVDYQAKYSGLFTGLVMSLLGIAFSMRRARSGGSLVSVGICLALVFFYWVFYNSSLTLGGHGVVWPSVAAWTPNLVMASMALLLLKLRRA